MKSFDINKRYLEIIRREIIEPACNEFRHELKLPSAESIPLSEREIEMFWGLHGRIFYLAIRRFVYDTPTPQRLNDVVLDAVRGFLDGARVIMPEVVR